MITHAISRSLTGGSPTRLLVVAIFFGFAGPKDTNVNDVVPKSRLGLLREAICIVNDLPKHGYKHSKTVLSDTGDPAHVAMPGTPNRVAVEAMATLHSPGSCQR